MLYKELLVSLVMEYAEYGKYGKYGIHRTNIVIFLV